MYQLPIAFDLHLVQSVFNVNQILSKPSNFILVSFVYLFSQKVETALNTSARKSVLFVAGNM